MDRQVGGERETQMSLGRRRREAWLGRPEETCARPNASQGNPRTIRKPFLLPAIVLKPCYVFFVVFFFPFALLRNLVRWTGEETEAQSSSFHFTSDNWLPIQTRSFCSYFRVLTVICRNSGDVTKKLTLEGIEESTSGFTNC